MKTPYRAPWQLHGAAGTRHEHEKPVERAEITNASQVALYVRDEHGRLWRVEIGPARPVDE